MEAARSLAQKCRSSPRTSVEPCPSSNQGSAIASTTRRRTSIPAVEQAYTSRSPRDAARPSIVYRSKKCSRSPGPRQTTGWNGGLRLRQSGATTSTWRSSSRVRMSGRNTWSSPIDQTHWAPLVRKARYAWFLLRATEVPLTGRIPVPGGRCRARQETKKSVYRVRSPIGSTIMPGGWAATALLNAPRLPRIDRRQLLEGLVERRPHLRRQGVPVRQVLLGRDVHVQPRRLAHHQLGHAPQLLDEAVLRPGRREDIVLSFRLARETAELVGTPVEVGDDVVCMQAQRLSWGSRKGSHGEGGCLRLLCRWSAW